MNSVLESLHWGEPISKILSHCSELDLNIPVVMQIRHTERPMNEPGSPDGFTLLSTEQGKKAAYELGTKLPIDKIYRLYHTYIDRTKETALEIQRGLITNKVNVEMVGSIPLTTVVNRIMYNEIAQKEYSLGIGYQDMGFRWLSNHYPPWIRVPSIVFAQRAASIMVENLRSADDNIFEVYVSHDIFIASFLFHWFGILPSDWVEFLDGFMLQLTEETMVVYTKYGKKELYYPYWWKSL